MPVKKKPGVVVGVDVGGTKILSLAVTQRGKILARKKCKTKPGEGVDAVIERLVTSIRSALRQPAGKNRRLEAVGLAFPGLFDRRRRVVKVAPNMPGWVDIPLVTRLEKELRCPVFLDNDVNMGTLGEFRLGAGQGCQHAIGVFVGTGIGGGLVFEGKLFEGAMEPQERSATPPSSWLAPCVAAANVDAWKLWPAGPLSPVIFRPQWLRAKAPPSSNATQRNSRN